MHQFCDKLLRKMQGVGGVRSLCVSCSGGVLQECYVTKGGIN